MPFLLLAYPLPNLTLRLPLLSEAAAAASAAAPAAALPGIIPANFAEIAVSPRCYRGIMARARGSAQ